MLAFPEITQKRLQEIRVIIKQNAPDAEEAISYAISTFKLYGKTLVHFAGFKSILGFMQCLQGTKLLKRNFQCINQEKVQYNFHWIGNFHPI